MKKPPPKTADLGSGLRWLVCPVCLKQLLLEHDAVRCEGCGRRYPVVDGIAVLLADRIL